MAWLSLGLLSATGVAVLWFALTSDERAARVDKVSFFLSTLFAVWAGVVAAYFGATAWINKQELRNGPDSYRER